MDGLRFTDDSISGYASSRQVATKILYQPQEPWFDERAYDVYK